jgi:hypothetical protein
MRFPVLLRTVVAEPVAHIPPTVEGDKAVTRAQKVLQKQVDADAASLKKEIEAAEK